MSSINEMIDRLTERQRYQFALACARRVQRLMRDPRSVAALDTRERWLAGSATDEEMASVGREARIVAYSEWSSYAVSDTYDEQAARAADAAATLVDSPSATAAELALRVSYTAANAVPYAAERAWQREELERMLRGGGA